MNTCHPWPIVATLLLTGVFPFALAHGETPAYPRAEWPTATPASMGVNENLLRQARDYALHAGGAGYVVYQGKLIMSWGDTARRFDLKSSTKSIGFTAMGLAMADGKVDLQVPACRYHPSFGVPPAANAEKGWNREITLFQLATQTAGFDKPGGYSPLLFAPGTTWSYSDCGPNWLAECLTHVYRRDLNDLLFERFFGPLGITKNDLTWRANQYRDHLLEGVARREFGSGISANVDAMARIGYCYLREGRWRDRQLIPASFVKRVRHTPDAIRGLPVHKQKEYGNAASHYGLLWWNNNDGTIPGVPVDAYWSWGLYDSLILVVPSLDLVVSRAGNSLRKDRDALYGKLVPFFTPIVAALPKRDPAKRRITGLTWAPPGTVKRAAKESDNWPLAWGDDDLLYTAYGDGYGFAHGVDRKLSLGLATIAGGPDAFTGKNLRASTVEQVGDGAKGKKASGLLMVDGTLYLLVRNAKNAQLAWSEDHGHTWAWCDWRFEESFGCPAFLDAGPDYADAEDGYVYILSQDTDSAYDVADQFVLARVAQNRIREKHAYRYFAGWADQGQPLWSENVRDRAPILRQPGRCYRGSMTYLKALDRYLLCTIHPGDNSDPVSGLGIFEAPRPWGPWNVVYTTSPWDMDPGESARIPSKWVSADGTTVSLVFSGEDSFSVRRATLHTGPIDTR